jgi:hypothetical protein
MGPMEPPIPFNRINLVGNGVIRGTTLILPSALVLDLLPHGLSLGEQQMTPEGSHPVVLFFQDMYRGHLTIPNLLPNLTYYEMMVGIPFAYVTSGLPAPGTCGPFFFMAQLFLTSFLATIGGKLGWGFAKELAAVTVDEGRYAVRSLDGDPLVSLGFEPTGGYRHVYDEPNFEPMRRVMSQPVISQVPAAIGPWFVASNFDKKWDCATLRPLSTVVHVTQAIVPGLPCGRFPVHGHAPGIDHSPLGSFELQARWRLTLPYPYLSHWRAHHDRRD